ncbi:hypothetical protein [Neptunicella sp. SCSIO 80796]|uniref:hypothetical protein n=1 Tax=Neptunicella plasticusilytica TaxID=3117012 RepID=UPI003A4D3BC5
MRLIGCMLAIAYSAMVSAHEDPFLGDGMGHSFFHLLFIGLLVSVVIKGVSYYRQRRQVSAKAKRLNIKPQDG